MPAPTHNDAILRAHAREREALLAKTHAAFASYYHSESFFEENEHDDADVDVDDDEEDFSSAPKYDARGRQAAFRETVRQRQARLAFLRRQDAARRRADRAQSVTATGAETIMVGFLPFTV